MKIKTMTSYGLVDDEGREFPTEWRACEWIDPYVEERDDGSVLVRYAVVDEDPSEYEWPEGVEFTLFSSGSERDEWIEANLDSCKCGWYLVNHDDDHRQEADDCGFDGPCDEPEPVFEWTDRHFWVERYEHGLVRYALMGESSQVDRQWDVAGGVAIIEIPADYVNRREAAQSILEEYTDWCNGNVYGVVEEVFYPNDAGGWNADDDQSDSCWGFIGTETAEAVVKEGL